MPNIIINPDFTDGLSGWTYSGGVESITERVTEPEAGEEAVVMPGARLPGGGYMGQYFGDATLSSGHLYFFVGPLSSRGYRLQVRFNYIDEFTETHETHAVAELPLEEDDYEMPLYMRISVPVDTSRHIKQFGITNMDLHESGAIFVNNFILQGDLVVSDEPDKGAGDEPRYMRAMPDMEARMIDRHFHQLEKRLDRILKQLRAGKSKSKKESSKKGKKGK